MKQHRSNQGRSPQQERTSFRMIKSVVIASGVISLIILTLEFIIL